MPTLRPAALVTAGVVVGLAVGGGAVAFAASTSSTVKVCVTSKNAVRAATAKSTCPSGTSAKAVGVQGPAGSRGPAGTPGAPGAPGAPGPGSVDIYATFMGGPSTIASLGPILVQANCNVYGPTFLIFGTNQSAGVRVSGTQSLGTAAPTTVQAPQPAFYGVIPNAETVSAQLAVTDLATHKTYQLSLYGNRPTGDSQCTYSGQLTP